LVSWRLPVPEWANVYRGLGNYLLLYFWTYYISFWLTHLLLLQCPWFPLNLILNYFFEQSGFHTFFFPSLHLVLFKCVFDRLFGGFDCLISFPDLIFVLWLIWLLARLMCSFCLWPGNVI
jgi:hypothetical protein